MLLTVSSYSEIDLFWEAVRFESFSNTWEACQNPGLKCWMRNVPKMALETVVH